MSDVPPPPPPISDPLAPFGLRVLAQLLDLLIVGLPVFIVALSLGVDLADSDNETLLWLNVALLAISLLYSTAFIAISGATLGKRIVKIKVVNRADGSPVGWNYAAVRALVPTVAGLIPVVGFALNIAVYVRAFFHPLRQGFHDAAAGTVVIRSR